jgi:DNA-directed RNA polymerase subunit RPC12/RpoP
MRIPARKRIIESLRKDFDPFRRRIAHKGTMSDTPATSEFKFYCSHCDQPLKCETRFAGRQIQCPGCQHLIRIPNPPAGSGFTQISPESGRTWDTHVPTRKKE